MAIIRLNQATLAYGDHALLDELDVAIEEHARIALVGRNGMGKSTLMRVLAGTEKLDSGEYTVSSGAKMTYLPQELPDANEMTVGDFLYEGQPQGAYLKEFTRLAATASTEKDLEKLAKVQEKIDAGNGWALQSQVDTSLVELGISQDTLMRDLSGGWRKRVSIVRAVLNKPDILLLDEPTNHLDIPAIEWLQKLLNSLSCALVFISHDRRFLDQIAENIWWLDRGKIQVFGKGYDNFLTQRDHFLAVEEKQNALFDKRLAEEEKWIRQGIKARRTRNEGRVRALKALRNERKARIDVKGNVDMQLDDKSRSGKIVAELENVSFAYPNKTILRPFDLLIQRGDRIGVIGRNGAGKSTLIKLLLGKLQPDTGTVKLGSTLEVAYFDQTRDQLDDSMTVADTIAEGRQSISINGREKHVMSYLGDFLFTPQRVRSPVSTLSGGEKNRLLLAKLFSKPANVLVLDEPTNDLDIETLELLEELLDQFKGTLIIVSHDREFVDQVVTSTVFIGDDGTVSEYVGGFDDLIRQHGSLWGDGKAKTKIDAKTKVEPAKAPEPAAKTQKLSYKLQRELEQLPSEIEKLETAITGIEAKLSDPSLYSDKPEIASELADELSSLQDDLEQKFNRWQELDEM